MIDGKDFYACWAVDGRGNVFLQYEDGDMAVIDPREFKQDDGV